MGFLWVSVWLLSRLTRFRIETIWLLAFCGYFSLSTNFRYGQFYIFLLFLLTLTFYFLDRKNYFLGGFTTGIAFGLKLYGGPFLLYFAAKRQWKAVLEMAVAGLILLGVALVLFGPADVHYYAKQILPRSLEGGSIDPYNAGTPTLSTMFRRTFVGEAELNPHPLWNAPRLFFFFANIHFADHCRFAFPRHEHTTQQRTERLCVVCDCGGPAFDQHGLLHVHHSAAAAGVAARGSRLARKCLSSGFVHSVDLALASDLAVSEGVDSDRALYFCGLSQLARSAAANRDCRGRVCSVDRIRGYETAHGELRKRTRATFCASCGATRGNEYGP